MKKLSLLLLMFLASGCGKAAVSALQGQPLPECGPAIITSLESQYEQSCSQGHCWSNEQLCSNAQVLGAKNVCHLSLETCL